MSLLTFTRVKMFTKPLAVIVLLFSFSFPASAEWNVDLSRRSKELQKKDYQTPNNAKPAEGIFDFLFDNSEPIQEVVILNTDKGFLPSTIRLKEGMQYKIHVVNVNEKDRNVSFVLDAFSEHHATYYGKIKTFVIHPKKEGVYSFQSPETSAQGRIVVHPAVSQSPDVRMPASE